MRDKLQEKAAKLGISLSEQMLGQFRDYYTLLLSWNQNMNLTTVTKYDDVVDRHFIDSLAAVQAFDFEKAGNAALLDLGSGAGFPGIPLKIAFPALSVTLLDARQKRVNFMDTVIQELGLQHIRAIHGRAEEFIREDPGGPSAREGYDLCVSRAVSKLSVLAEYCLPYVKVGGTFLAYKSADVDDEVEEAKDAIFVLGGKLEEIYRFTLPDTDLRRTIVKIKKVRKTDNKYPRKAGKPEKEPVKF